MSDLKAESYESGSPYAYAFDNPIRFIDIAGRDPGDVVVIFDGADLSSLIPPGNGQEMVDRLDMNGGTAKAFVGQYWITEIWQGQYGPVVGYRGPNMNSQEEMNTLTQAAYDYIKENRKKDGRW